MRSPLRATLLFEVKWAISKPFRMVGRVWRNLSGALGIIYQMHRLRYMQKWGLTEDGE